MTTPKRCGRLVASFANVTCLITALVVANSAAAQLASPVITTVAGGRVQVKNSGPSKWAGTSGWKLTLERTIMPPEGSPGMLERPSRLAVDATGQILVYDAGNAELRLYAADGKFLRKIGEKGEGPGEYGFLLGFDVRDGIIVGYDPNLRRLLVWKSDGTFIRQFATPSSNCGSGPTVLEANATVVIPVCINRDGTSRGALVRFSLTGQTRDTILLPPSDVTTQAWKTGTGLQRIPFAPNREYTVDSRLRYVHGWNASYSLVVANRGIDTARVIQMPGKSQPIPAKFIDSLYERTQRGALKGIAKRSDFPTEFPYFTGLHSDELDNIWIDRPGPDNRTAQYDVIDRDGRFLGTVTAPPGVSRGSVWRNGRMYRASENADGLPVIQVFRVDRGRY